MEVTCPGCQSRFLLPDGVKPGVRLRCSVCKTEFVFEEPRPAADSPAEEETKLASAAPMDAAPQAAEAASDQPAQQEPEEELGAGAFAEEQKPFSPSDSVPLPELGVKEKKGHGLLVLFLILVIGAGVAWFTVPQVRTQVQAWLGSAAGKPAQKAEAPAKAPEAAPKETAAPAEAPAAPVKPEAAAPVQGKAAAGKEAAAAVQKELVLGSVRYRYVENPHAGTLLLVEGEVLNQGKEEQGDIKLHASLLNQDRKILDAQVQKAGVQLTEEQLAGMTRAELYKAFNDSKDQTLSDIKVPAGGKLPFMIVFYNITDDVAEFAVKIEDGKTVPAVQGTEQGAAAPQPAPQTLQQTMQQPAPGTAQDVPAQPSGLTPEQIAPPSGTGAPLTGPSVVPGAAPVQPADLSKQPEVPVSVPGKQAK